jgi:predicted DNA-binding ribbon-helix-helix protein
MWRTNMGASLEILLKNHFPPVSTVSASPFAAWHECVNHSSRMARWPQNGANFLLRYCGNFYKLEVCFMKSPVVKRSVVVSGHKTSVSLEDAFWNSLKEISSERQMTLSALVAAIDNQRQHSNLSSAIRLYVLDFYRTQLSDAVGRRDAKKRLMVVDTAHPHP